LIFDLFLVNYKFEIKNHMQVKLTNIILMFFLGGLFYLSLHHVNNIVIYFSQVFPIESYLNKWSIYIPFIPEFLYPYLSINLVYGFVFLMIAKNHYAHYMHNIIYSLVIQFLLNQIFYMLLYFAIIFNFDLNWQWLETIIQTTQREFLFTHVLDFHLPYHQTFLFYFTIAVAFFLFYHPHLQKMMLKITFSVWFLLMSLSMLMLYKNQIADLFMGSIWFFI
jgi:hypothetical protein